MTGPTSYGVAPGARLCPFFGLVRTWAAYLSALGTNPLRLFEGTPITIDVRFVLSSPRPMTVMMTRTSAATGSGMALSAVILLILEKIDAQSALFYVGLSALFSLLIYWPYRPSASDEVRLDAEGVVLHTRKSDVVLRREHIVSARVMTFSRRGAFARLIAFLMGVDFDRRFVEVQLTRRIRSLGQRRVGTGVWGIPLPGKYADLYVEDPDGFLQAVSSYLVA